MKSYSRSALCFFALLILAGCASTKVTEHEIYVLGGIPHPDHILVYDFAATPADVPPTSVIARDVVDAPQTPEEIAVGRELGAQIAEDLVKRIRDMGLPAERASRETKWYVNDIVLRGFLVSVDEGSEAARLTVGFRQGVSELKTAVEGLQVTPQGLRRIGFGTLESAGSKTPGMLVPAALWVATGSPVGLAVSGTMRVSGELTGRNTIEGRADETAKTIAEVLKERFKQQGWIN